MELWGKITDELLEFIIVSIVIPFIFMIKIKGNFLNSILFVMVQF